MKIPNSERAIIEPSKLIDYLLNPNHKRGGTKAKLLIKCGYSQKNWQQLENEIRKAHLSQPVDIIKESDYGKRYEIIAELSTPLGKKILVKTVGQIDKGTDFPRLITLVPDREKGENIR